jgi:predicted TIM-barrel fold metal-dependent hydrolase
LNVQQQTLESPEAGPQDHVAIEIVDCDVHPSPSSVDELLHYLKPPWRDMPRQLHDADGLRLYYPPSGYRDDAGPKPGSDPDVTARQLLVEAGVDIGMLLATVRTYFNPDYESALCAATNDWLADTWLSRYNDHERWRGSVAVCANAPELAAREIDRWSGHPYMAQIRLNAYAGLPFGDPFYDPIYEAATRAGLPVGVHFTKGSGHALLTPVGHQSYFFEHHALYPVTYAAHAASLICNGTFDRFEDLKFVWIEGGYSWSLPLLWRLERRWDDLGSELPAKRRPREYVRDHMWWTSQPIEEPGKLTHLWKVMEWADAAHTLLFSSDYPHWDYDDPAQIVRRLPKEIRRRVFCESAIELYGLPRTRRAAL